MKNQHTPGPWNPSAGKIIASNAMEVCSMPNRDSANANLIAAAPDLLSALRFLLADYIAIQGDKLTGSSVPIEMAQAAISKAEGAQ